MGLFIYLFILIFQMLAAVTVSGLAKLCLLSKRPDSFPPLVGAGAIGLGVGQVVGIALILWEEYSSVKSPLGAGYLIVLLPSVTMALAVTFRVARLVLLRK